MDAASLATLLKQTLDPELREQAEGKLSEVKKIIGFCPGILQVVMTNTVDSAVRQAGVIYFKNLVSQSWVAKEDQLNAVCIATGNAVNTDLTFAIHEQDKVKKNIGFFKGVIHKLRWQDLIIFDHYLLNSPTLAFLTISIF